MAAGDRQKRSDQAQTQGPAQPLGTGSYAALAFLSLVATLLIAYGMYLANQSATAAPVIRSYYYVLLWVLGITAALFLFGVLRSSASLRGQQWGTAVELGGPVVIGVLVVAGGYKFSQMPDTFALTVRLSGPYPVEEMSRDAKIWIDLNGRRDHPSFGSDGQVVIQEVPANFMTDPVAMTFESNVLRVAEHGNSLSVTVPANRVVSIRVVKISQSEQRRERLAEKYSIILSDISLELSRKQAFLFPAIDRYVAEPTPEGWQAVWTAAQDSLQRIQRAMDEEVEYQSQQRLMDLVHQTSMTVASSGNLPLMPLVPAQPPFDATLNIHSQRSVELSRLPSGPLPDVVAVQTWKQRMKGLYEQMQGELTHLIAQLRE